MSLLGLGGVELVVDVFFSAHRFIIINNKHPSPKTPTKYGHFGDYGIGP